MFNFLRNITKSAEEKRQEAVAAYLDGMLNQREQRQFEQELAQDAALQAEVEQLRLVKQSLRQLPQREVPRNFILDPAQYGRPARQPWVQAYPVLRTATAFAAFFFIFAVAAGIFTGFGAKSLANEAPAVADVAQVDTVDTVEMTRVVSEEAPSAFEFAAEAVEEEAVSTTDSVEEADAGVAEPVVEGEVAEDAGEVVENEPPPEAQATQAAISTAVPQSANTLQEELSEEENTVPAPVVLPTSTVSKLPRVTPPTPLPERDLESEEVVADGETAETTVEDGLDEAVSVTAVPTQPSNTDATTQSANPLPWLQVGLGLLLLLLTGLTIYARRQH